MKTGAFRNFLTCNDIYNPEDIETVIAKIRPHISFAWTNTDTKYYNVPCSFDIETTSFFRSTGNGKESEKVAIMYEWTFGIFGTVIIGRTWEEYVTMINKLCRLLDLSDKRRLLCYCHNLSFEFQFMRKWFTWDKVFAIDNHKPIYAKCTNGIEYRCSMLLSGYSLENLAKNLQQYNIKKLVGDLDYSLIRHSKTPLTDAEIGYCVNDVKIVMAYIAETIERDGDIGRIPLTKTGYVRNYCRNACFYTRGIPRKEDYKRLRYLKIMKRLRLTADEYKQLKRAFQGGFTHANPFASGKVYYDITSFDFTSSYPFVMLSEQFPMSASERIENITMEEFTKSLNLYCCLFDVEFVNLRPKILFENYISISRCYESRGVTVNNGRVVDAGLIKTTVTEVDYKIIQKCYEWDSMRISNFRRYKKDYLPTDFVKAIIKLYKDKTMLKGVDGKEVEYMIAKEMLNSCYGMCVTDIVREMYIYNGEKWLDDEEKPEQDTDALIKKYNNNNGRFLFYPWGVWVTAYARRNLWTGILEFKGDYLYSDTDSIKVKNAEKHMDYITRYNTAARKQLEKAMRYHKIDISETEPKTKDGVKKPLGVWDFDGHYYRFKTLGAKRYMVEYSHDERNSPKNRGKLTITVSGLNKNICVPYMINKWAKSKNDPNLDVFNHFCNEMYIPPEYTGKNVHFYIESEKTGKLTDYTGITEKYRELSGVHLAQAEYSLKLSKQYADYLAGLEEDEW